MRAREKEKDCRFGHHSCAEGQKGEGSDHRPRYIKPAAVPEFGEGASSTAEARQAAPIAQSAKEPIVVPKVPTVGPAEARDDKAEEPQVEKVIKAPEILSPPIEANSPKIQKNFCHNSQKEEDGQCIRRCYRDYEGPKPCP